MAAERRFTDTLSDMREGALRETLRFSEAQSFCRYVNTYKNAASLVFATRVKQGDAFEAVLDYHDVAGSPKWGDHRAILKLETTPAWDEWIAHNKKPLSQVDFARFIEEHIPHIAEPSGAQLLEMCATLEAKKDVKFRASTRFGNGQHQFKYEEEITGTAGAQGGQLAIPDGSVLGLEPYRGFGVLRVDARFRYRIANSGLTLFYELVRPDDVLEAAYEQLTKAIESAIGSTPVLYGAIDRD